MSPSAFPQWSAMTPGDRDVAADRCREAGGALGEAFQLFAETGTAGDAAGAAGPLAGLPYAAKDMFDLAGRAPLCGLAAPLSPPPAKAAEILRLLDDAGAIRVGLARMSKLAFEPSGIGTARNPWDPEFATGGSSSGSGAAVACGAAFVAIGSDTAGSVRIPASCCGVTGWKPSPALVPDDGAMVLSPSLDTIGLFARGAADILMVADATGLFDRANAAAETAGDVGRKTNGSIAIAEDLLPRCDPSVRSACEDGIAVLRRLGRPSITCRAGPAIDDNAAAALRVLGAECARAFGEIPALSRDEPDLARRLSAGLAIDDDTLRRDLDGRPEARAAFIDGVFGGADVLVTPAMAIRTPSLAEVDRSAPGFSGRTLYALSAFLRFANYLGLPALALPTGFDDRGMPVALQLVGRPDTDRALLELGAAFQAASNSHGRVPPHARPILEATEGLSR